jgi:hypothetical protein
MDCNTDRFDLLLYRFFLVLWAETPDKYIKVVTTTAALNDLPMRFGFRSQRQQFIFVANNQRFDV